MSVAEMKIEVIRRIDSLTEEQLNQVNIFIESINGAAPNSSKYLQEANKIIAERNDVLHKLAQ